MKHTYKKEKKRTELFWKDSQRWHFMNIKVLWTNLGRSDCFVVRVLREVRAKCMRPKQIFDSPEKKHILNTHAFYFIFLSKHIS